EPGHRPGNGRPARRFRHEPFRRAGRPMPGCEADASLNRTRRGNPMSRKFIVALAAVAALGTLIATDASARFGGGGGGHFTGGGHASFSRSAFHPARINTGRTMSRTFHTSRVTAFKRVNRPNMSRPNFRHFHHAHYHHNHYRWWWCRHHHYRCGG